MQALSFAVHIPLVCFGVAFPALVLFVEWLCLRTGDPSTARSPRRWSKVMMALFAVGVVTGTILQLRARAAVAGFMATFGDVFGLGFALEGVLVLPRGDLHRDLRLRLGPAVAARALLAGIPVVIAGITGSLIVIAVNGWMNHPTGFRVRGRASGRRRPVVGARSATRTSGTSWCTCTWPAFIVAGFVTASVYAVARLRGRRAAMCGWRWRSRSRRRRSPHRRR